MNNYYYSYGSSWLWWLLCSFFMLSNLSLFAQEPIWYLSHRIPIATPTAVSVNKQNHILVADNRYNLTQYDTSGKVILQFSMPQMAEAQLIEAWQTVRTVVFYQDLQEIFLFDRFLNLKTSYKFLPSSQIGFVSIATISPTGEFWIMDNTDFRLKKYNPDFKEINLFISLDFLLANASYKISFLREYQNLLFVTDTETGIWIFDNLGNFKQKLAYPNVKFIGVWREEIYFLQKNQLVFYHLYQQTTRTVSLPQSTNDYLFALFLDTHYALFTATDLLIYHLK
ncbi:MAG: hypothetical protein NZ551_10255 [Microscillaceae bacterium]|nr:hypothetical protein [Microscillaceae bacterium]MDW8461579.1 hypothetical protein [Cytophagales bacterium]